MKIIRKRIVETFIVAVTLLLTFLALSNVTIKAENTVKDDAGTYNYTTVNEDKREIINGVEYIKNTGYTTRSGKNYDQRVSIFTADLNENSNIKIATWNTLNGKGTGFTRKGLLDIAKDYEANNPGWIVLAGINADQYFPTFGTGIGSNGAYYFVPSAYYGQISNGDNWFVTSPYNNSNNIVGFKNDGSAKPFVNGVRNPKGFYLHIYDEKMEEIGLFPIDGLNVNPGENGVSILASYITDKDTYSTVSKSGNNDIYLIGDADMTFVSDTVEWKSWNSSATDQFFGKGFITEINKDVNFTGGNKFALEVTNEDVKKLLSVGTYVKAQREFDDEFNGIEEGIGYHTIQRKDGADMNVANSYNSRPYPRSCFGFDANGKAYLMTNFGYNGSPQLGLYAQECNALFKKYGVTDAWQMDGGGSVTCICRDENGILNYAEACIEASKGTGEVYSDYRYILSGLFIVMKVAEAKIEVKEKTSDSVILTVDSSKLRNEYAEACVKIMDDEGSLQAFLPIDLTKDTQDVKAIELKSNTNYSYEIFVKKANEAELRTFINGSFNTLKDSPTLGPISITKTSEGYDVSLSYQDDAKSLVMLYGFIGQKRYSFEIKDGTAKLKVKGEANIFDLEIKADCSLDENSSGRTEVEFDGLIIKYPIELYFAAPIMKTKEFMSYLYE